MKPGDKVEWHDARVERMELLAAGEARIVCSRVYFYEASDRGPVTRLRPAEVLLRNVTAFTMKGQYAYEGFVSYANVELPDGTTREAGGQGEGGEVAGLMIRFTNGAELEVRCGWVALQFTD